MNVICSEIITRWGKQKCLNLLSKKFCTRRSIFIITGSRRKQNAFSRVTLAINASMIKNVLRLAHFTCSLGGCPPISQHTSKNFFFVTFHEVPNSNCSIVRTSGKFTIRWAKTISEKQRKQNISIEIY